MSKQCLKYESAFNQKKAIVKTDGSFAALLMNSLLRHAITQFAVTLTTLPT